MSLPDFNLLVTLDALLAEGSVAAAARRLQLSPSAMSRALARLRETTGDPLLVRAGRGLVPSPRALELRDTVPRLVQDAQAALRPSKRLDLRRLVRGFTLRTSEGFVETFGPALVARVAEKAPGVVLRFETKLDKDSTPLRDGSADLETGVVGRGAGPELRAQALFRDRFIGVVRRGHPLCKGPLDAARYAQARHVMVARRGKASGPVDEALAAHGLSRQVATVVSGFSLALSLVRGSDLVASVPERHTAGLRQGLHAFVLPVPVAPITVSLLWHPRMDGDAAHRWLRGCVREVCADAA
jgi:DNA-binding transcriptional LysR family regulator